MSTKKNKKVRLTREEATWLINNKTDFIFSEKYQYSLEKLLDEHPSGVENRQVARYMMIPEKEVEKILASVIRKFRNELKISYFDIDDHKIFW